MTFDIDEDGVLDNTPLKFGKYKGKTPTQVHDGEVPDSIKRAKEWLVWAYENVGNFPVCSHALYKSAGGKGSSAARAKSTSKSANKAYGGSASYDGDDDTGRYSSRASSPAKPASSWDDMDDDIPF